MLFSFVCNNKSSRLGNFVKFWLTNLLKYVGDLTQTSCKLFCSLSYGQSLVLNLIPLAFTNMARINDHFGISCTLLISEICFKNANVQIYCHSSIKILKRYFL